MCFNTKKCVRIYVFETEIYIYITEHKLIFMFSFLIKQMPVESRRKTNFDFQ